MKHNDMEESPNLINLYSYPHESMNDFVKRIYLYAGRGFDIIGYFEGKKVDTRDYMNSNEMLNFFKSSEEVVSTDPDEFINEIEQEENINTSDQSFGYNDLDEPSYSEHLVKKRNR